MKRRIIGMILVVVMLTLSLVSCGYSFKKDDMSKYAALSEEDKETFLKAIEKIIIEDGDFSTDPEERKNRVIDFIYQNVMSSAADTSDTKNEGVPGTHDKVYYYYYVTADFDGTVAMFDTANMKSASANIVLGLIEYDDEVKEAVAAGFASLDFKDKIHSATTSGKTKTGDIAYVTYTCSYKVKNAEGVEQEKTIKVSNKQIVIGTAPTGEAKATTMADYLAGKDIGKSVDKVNMTDATLGEVAYSDIMINWVSSTNTPAFTFTDVTYTENETQKDTDGNDRELKDKLLTYHVFPSYYIVTPEYNSTNLLDLYFGANLTVESLYAIILGEDYTNLDEKEDKEKIEERAEIIKDLKTAEGDGFEAFAKKLVQLYKDIEETEKAKDNAASDLSKATQNRDNAKNNLETEKAKTDPDPAKVAELESLLATAEANLATAKDAETQATAARDTAKANLDAEKAKAEPDAAKVTELEGLLATAEATLKGATESKTAAEKARDEAKKNLDTEKAKKPATPEKIAELEGLLASAEEALTKAETADTNAKEENKTKVAEKDAYIKSFLAVTKDGETLDVVIERRYREETYKALQEDYNETIRMNLAKEIYYFLTEAIKLSDALPEKAVDMAYESMMENYETEFYTGTYSDKVSNYKQYKTFKKFLVAKVTSDYKTVTTYEEAKKVVREEAGEYVKPLVKIYLAAEIFDLKVTDKEFKEYKNDPENEYEYNVYTYGENSVLHAYQLDKILDHFAEFEESEAVKDANGYDVITYNFKKLTYEFGTPASDAAETEDKTESDDGHDH